MTTEIKNELRRLALPKAWAIVRPYPNKDKLLIELLKSRRYEILRPVLPIVRAHGAMVPKAMFPGYLFVRPPIGQRRALRDQPYIAHILDVVVFENVIDAIEAYVEREMQEHHAEEARKRGASKRRVIKSFADLVLKLVSDPIDTNRLFVLLDGIERHSAACAAMYDQYLGTDDLPEAGEQQCSRHSEQSKTIADFIEKNRRLSA